MYDEEKKQDTERKRSQTRRVHERLVAHLVGQRLAFLLDPHLRAPGQRAIRGPGGRRQAAGGRQRGSPLLLLCHRMRHRQAICPSAHKQGKRAQEAGDARELCRTLCCPLRMQDRGRT